MTNQVSFGQQSGGMKSVIGSVGGSALNIGATVGAGAGIGAAIGKLASLTPYKVTAEELNYQYADMFYRAVNSAKRPEYMKNMEEGAKKGLRGLIKEAKTLGGYSAVAKRAAFSKQSCEEVLKAIEEGKDVVADKSVQTFVKTVLKSTSEEPLGLDTIKSTCVSHLKKANKIVDKVNGKKLRKVSEIVDDFISQAGQNERMKELAEKGAKHLRTRTIIGAGIAIGVVGALLINVLNTNGVFKKLLGKRAKANPQQTAQMSPAQMQQAAALQMPAQAPAQAQTQAPAQMQNQSTPFTTQG